MKSMKAFRIRALLRNLPPFSLQKFTPFSSSSAANSKPSTFFSGDSEGRSEVYRQVLKFQRPTTINWRDRFQFPNLYRLRNSVGLIGSVDRLLKVHATTNGRFGVYTLLNVKTSRDSGRTFKISVQMWDEMAKISFKHLKPDDFVYVSGQLGSYTKTDLNGKPRTSYTVIVKQLNYVAQHGQGPSVEKIEKSESAEGAAGLEKYRDRLHLWQFFFTNPYDWWDNRKSKLSPTWPDFRHKDTGEVLWIGPDDPPWVKRQLQLHDSRMAERGQWENESSRARLSTWVYDDYI